LTAGSPAIHDPPMLRVFIALAVFSAPAMAASGQFEGVYVREGAAPLKGNREILELKCALAPVVIGQDGLGAGYFLDADALRKTGTLSYVKAHEFDCRYNPATKVETCQSKELSDGRTLHYYRSNVYQVFTPDLQQGHSLLSPEEVADWTVSQGLNPANRFAYHRCKCLTRDKVEARASTAVNQLSGDETSRRLYWDDEHPSADDLSLARDALDKLGACNVGETS
jgi:hypothetical protein